MFACLHSEFLPRHSARACAYAFSPRVETISGDTVAMDLAGLESLFGSTCEIAYKMAAHAARARVTVNVAVSENLDTAILASRGVRGITIISSGRESEMLAPLPLELLAHALFQASPEILETFARWGLRTFADLAALPLAGITERLGQEGLRLWRLARGAGERVLVPAIPPLHLEQSTELEYPVHLLEPLAFILASLLNPLCAALEGRALAAQELRLKLKLEDGTCYERALSLPFPLRDSRVWLKLWQLDIEQHPPPAAILAISLVATPAKPRVIQNGLFLPPIPEPEKLELTLARIARLVGGDRVGVPQLLDTHRPDAFKLQSRMAGGRLPASGFQHKEPSSTLAPTLAFRVFRHALPARVRIVEGVPTWMAAHGLSGRVVSLAGPWRASGEWWKREAWAREEWDVALADGALCRIYKDGKQDGWFVEGIYD